MIAVGKMTATCLLVLVLAAFGASAAPCNFGLYSSDCDCSPHSIPGPTTCVQTPVVENTPTYIPSIIPPTSVSQSCHCFRTIVRPQIRNEVITVPTVDRIVRLVASPVVETVNGDETSRIVDRSTYSQASAYSGAAVNGCSGLVADVYPEVTLDGCRGTVVGCISRPRFGAQVCKEVVGVC